MLVDPAGRTSADEFWVLCYGSPVSLVFDLRVYEGHFLRARDALVPVNSQYSSYPKRSRMSENIVLRKAGLRTDRNLLYTIVAL